jgi:hypothetical protein
VRLQAEEAALWAANTRQKQQERTQPKAIANGGTMIGEGLDRLNTLQSQQQAQDEVEVAEVQTGALIPKKRAAPKCSLCALLEHNKDLSNAYKVRLQAFLV